MDINSILDYNLIKIGDYKLNVFNLITVIIILISTKIVLTLTKRIIKRQEKKDVLDIGKSNAIYQIIKYIIWITAILLILDTVNIKITFLLASSAALLVGLGLGLQKIFQDFVSGITLLIEGTLKVGDIVETAKGEVGRVQEVNLRTSKLKTRDNIILIVPNSTFINDSVINWSHMGQTTRFGIKVGVAYGSNTELVAKLLLKCIDEHKDIVKKPGPVVFFRDFGNSSLDFEVLFYTNETFRVERIKSEVRYKIDKEFRENGITIPFPQRDIHLKKE